MLSKVFHVPVKVILYFPSLHIYWTMLKHTNIKLVLHLWTKSFLGITYCVSMHCRPLSAMRYLRYYASVHKWNCYFFWILPCLLKILFFNYVNLCVCACVSVCACECLCSVFGGEGWLAHLQLELHALKHVKFYHALELFIVIVIVVDFPGIEFTWRALLRNWIISLVPVSTFGNRLIQAIPAISTHDRLCYSTAFLETARQILNFDIFQVWL